MRSDPHAELGGTAQLTPHEPVLRAIVLLVLFAAGLGIRLRDVTLPLTDFHPMRQYRGALMARAFYYGDDPAIPEWQREVAQKNLASEGFLEPPVMELMVSTLYRIAGEHLWIPRLLSSVFWVMGGVFLYLLAKRMLSADGALFATAFYLLLPFGVVASRSFQPDPLMIMLLMASLLTIWLYHEKPSTKGLILAAAISGLALFIKPICIFAVYMSFVALAIYRHRTWKAIFKPDFIAFAAISFAPTAVYYLPALFARGGSRLQVNARAQFVPKLLFEQFFWAGWFVQVGRVVGTVPFAGAFIGLLLLPKGRSRFLLAGLWIGYVLFGMTFTYLVSTHDYYQLQLIPVVALSLSPLVTLIMGRIRQIYAQPYWRAAVLVLLLILSTLFSVYENWWRSFFPFYTRSNSNIVWVGPEVGDHVKHSPRTVFLTEAYGTPLAYYAELAGSNWPSVGDVEVGRIWNDPVLSVQERFEAMCIVPEVEYFIVTDFLEFARQPELQEILYNHYPVLAEGEGYLIFDLRTTSD